MKNIDFIIILVQVCFIFLSCDKKNNIIGIDEVHLIISNYYQNKLSLMNKNEDNILEERTILNLTELRGKRIIQARFITPDELYVVFEGTEEYIEEDITEETVYIRMYDIASYNYKDIFIYNVIFDNIRIIDVEKYKGYFSGYVNKNYLMCIDFQDRECSTIFKFPDGEEIITIDCNYSEEFIIINTYEKLNNLFRYYFIDRISYKKINEDDGQIYLSKRSDFIIYEKDSKIYILNNIINPINKIEIPFEKNEIFARIIFVNRNSFIICSFSTSSNIIGNFLFGGNHLIEHYNYQFVKILNNDGNIFIVETYKIENISQNKVIFDVITKQDNKL